MKICIQKWKDFIQDSKSVTVKIINNDPISNNTNASGSKIIFLMQVRQLRKQLSDPQATWR